MSGLLELRKIRAEQIKITDSEYGKTWDQSLCQNCSHVFANPAPKPTFIQAIYSQVEDPHYAAVTMVDIVERMSRPLEAA